MCPKKISCRSKNLIHCISCKNCGLQYVGQTRNELRQRMNSHISTINTKGNTPIARHMNDHDDKLALKVHILQLIRSDDVLSDQLNRNKWENIWMSRLYTIVPKGLNIMD